LKSATAYNTLDELQADLQSVMVDANGRPNGTEEEATQLFVTVKEQIGHRDPLVVAYAALTLAKWATDRIPR
jgi:hypothetical protein